MKRNMPEKSTQSPADTNRPIAGRVPERPLIPLPNYSLSTVCPACSFPTIRRACKVRCERCGFVWDCSEL
ncbi:MAG: hypothetical protein K8I30_13575 [Anaerolineae bacterium]|nr:hypothetical protein [Anaerolineae bacterium]